MGNRLITRLVLSGILVLIFIGCVFAVECPDNSKAPACPTSESTLLDETYPVQAYVISNAPMSKGIKSSQLSSNYIKSIAKSYDYKNMPQVLIPVETEAEFQLIIVKVQESLEKDGVSKGKISKIISQISHVPAKKFTWQQDYFESFVDPDTGTPVLREFESYFRSYGKKDAVGTVSKLEAASSACNIKKGDSLVSHFKKDRPDPSGKNSFGGGEMGGNVEGAPGGFCLTGDNLSHKFSNQFCGKEDNIIQLQASWLKVGHVDEIFKIIPSNFKDGRPSECQFTLLSASPKKAMELMGSTELKDNSFYSFSEDMDSAERQEMKEARSKSYPGGNEVICNYMKAHELELIKIKDSIESKNKSDSSRLINEGKGVYLKFFSMDANAQSMGTKEFDCQKYIEIVPNSLIKASIEQDKDMLNLNNTIQVSIDKDKAKIKDKILSRLPQCEKYFDSIDVPNLFYGDPPSLKNGKYILDSNSDIQSILPNPTNSVVMNKTLLYPETGNKKFDSYLEKELTKRKMKAEKIDTWSYAHVGDGNMHCSSHSIPYCKPRK